MTSGAGGPDTALLQRLVDHVDVPAYCTDALTNVLAWNTAAAQGFNAYLPADARTAAVLLTADIST